MKPLVITQTSRRFQEAGWHQGIENTYLDWWPRFVDHKFVYGARGCHDPGPGDLIITEDTSDSYDSEPARLVGACKWALEHGYDHMFKTDLDTYVVLGRLIHCGFENWEYMGLQCPDALHASGGAGFWLGKKAMEIIAQQSTTHAEFGDLWVGHLLAKNGILVHNDNRFVAVDQHGPPFNHSRVDAWGKGPSGIITVHLGRGTGNYDWRWMLACHHSYKHTVDLQRQEWVGMRNEAIPR